MRKYINTFYRIRLKDNIGKYNEWHSSNNGTSQWGTLAKIKAILTRGIQGGYKGRIRDEFVNYEVREITQSIHETEVIIDMENPHEPK